MATTSTRWTRSQLLIALDLYFELPFAQFSQTQPRIIEVAGALGRSPSALAMKLSNFASLDDAIPQAGLKNVSQADRDLWSALRNEPKEVELEIVQARAAVFHSDAQDTVEELTVAEADAESTETTTTATVRRGQEIFRRAVLSAYGSACCITGIRDPRLLIASHIKPWSDDPKSRLDPRNGLCLNALHDKAFDQGLVTIDEDYCLQLSPRVNVGTTSSFGQFFDAFVGKPISLPAKFPPSQEHLAYHRDHIFVR